jgi:integrase
MTHIVMHLALGQALAAWRRDTCYGQDDDWMFASRKAKGKFPRTPSIAAQDYLRPVAVKAGVIPTGYRGRFGWHNLRHSLATFLGAEDVNLQVIQSILRHTRSSTTALYTHRVNAPQLAAQQKFLEAINITAACE